MTAWDATLPADTRAFLDLLQRLEQHASAEVRSSLRPGPVVVSRAPGRLDVMGGIADYSGSLVLQWPIAEATHAAVQLQPSSPTLDIVSVLSGGDVRSCQVPVAALTSHDGPVTYDEARAWFATEPARHWAAYVAGAWLVLARERQWPIVGARVLVSSNVPEGKGVSSSAALEASVLQALAVAAGVALVPRDLAILAQKVENLVVGAPCGVMDQMASVLGEQGRLMALLCQPAEFKGTVPLPDGLAVWGIDSGIRHAVSGADYGSVRIGAFMGYRMLADTEGFAVTRDQGPGHVCVHDDRWYGYLANVGASTFGSLALLLPGHIGGGQFLSRYGGTTDPVTTVNPEESYAVRLPTRHPVLEHVRVSKWYDALHGLAEAPAPAQAPDLAAVATRIGALMYESHASYTACGLGSSGTDRLVALARDAGPARGIFGAKITGGGSGGTVALLTRADARAEVQAIAASYAAETGRTSYLFEGSSPGAATFGTMTVTVP